MCTVCKVSMITNGTEEQAIRKWNEWDRKLGIRLVENWTAGYEAGKQE